MMMIMGGENFHSNPTVQVPPWDDPTDHIHSPLFSHGDHQTPVLFDELEMAAYDDVSDYDDVPLDAFSCDHFRMYEFKIRRCARARSHDWTECPYAHPGEKARRRDPRKFNYSGNPCPEFRKGTCHRGDTCEYAHGVFECWLHPSRYRTQPCKDGVMCRRRICFFAHTAEQLRVFPVSQNGNGLSQPESYDGSPSRLGKSTFGSSPTSTLFPSTCSPPMSPISSIGQNSVNELTSSVRNMQIGSAGRLSMSPMSVHGFCSARNLSTLRPGYASLPSTPTRNPTRTGNTFDLWEQDVVTREEPVMERVESGKEIRAKMYAKLSRENSLAGRVDPGQHDGWVSELVN
ncbi:hypothetical protein SSX86_006022 [Deinandra increscens subsp. villosa]|uniref:C3H1-type domain-containing protein n=1 Tax=Deinandra increscens subsp. villosa TaxID=3103831 RepID=A0AAP0HCF9_9ASTR